MSATTTGFKTILLAEIRAAGDSRARQTIDAILAEVFDTIWAMYSDAGLRNPRLQYLYAKRQVIEFWKSGSWRDVDFTDDVEEALGQMSKNLDLMAKGLDTDISTLEKVLNQAFGPAVGQMTTTTPLAGLTGQPDPNHPVYRGDPRYRGGLVR
jgi:hypothetical protein